MKTPEEMNWFLRGGKHPEPALPSKTPVVCQNCGGENLADEEQCTHCGAPLQGGTTTEEYCGGNDEDGVGDKICPECGHCWPSDTEQCPMCHSTLRAPDQKTWLVKVSQVKKCLWEGYVEIVADSRLEALVKAKDEFDNCGLDTWDLVDPELDSENDEEPVFSVEPEA